MNKAFASLLIALGLALSARAESSATISGVHLCCQSCVKGVEHALSGVKGATAEIDKDAGSVTLKGADLASVQKAADALTAAGYYGKSSDSRIKIASDQTAGKKVESLKLEGVHLCCGKCVNAVDKALKSVSGVKEHTAKKNAESFEVTGDFNDKDVLDALHKAGLSAKSAK